VGIPLGFLGIGYQTGAKLDEPVISLGNLRDQVEEQSKELSVLQEDFQSNIRAMTISLGKLQARLTRIDALGIHLTNLVGIENEEFDFSNEPALGGPLIDDLDTGFQVDFMEKIRILEEKIYNRVQQIENLESLIRGKNSQADADISGWPVNKGWISSPFGRRTDPFTGKLAMHQGVDFAGTEGHEVLSLGAGIVTYSGYMQGYGEMVEISHSDGFTTRYAHAQENLVKVGELVPRGKPIALVGSTGRSTGAHVHLEVYKNGRAIDPSKYIKRNQP
tara:strand:+ start:73 stop:900 length:828 start_codon:yes stop_codon:yes gene_type:complete